MEMERNMTKKEDDLMFLGGEMTPDFFGARDVTPEVDYFYLKRLRVRLAEIVWQLFGILPPPFCPADVGDFVTEEIAEVYEILYRSSVFEQYYDRELEERQGKRVEDAYYFWMRERVLLKLFLPSIAYLFQVPLFTVKVREEALSILQTENERNLVELRSYFAKKEGKEGEKELSLREKQRLSLAVEVYFDFSGKRPMAAEKIKAAKKRYEKTGMPSPLLYIDLPHARGAMLSLETLAEDMTVVPTEDFVWSLNEIPPMYFFDEKNRIYSCQS